MPVTQDAGDLKQLLTELVAFKTVSGENRAARDCADYLESYLTGRGMYVQRHISKGFPSLVATTKETKTPKVLLQAHLDVVPCSESLFELKESTDGHLVARGVFDMKFAGAVFLKLVDELKDQLADYDFGLMFSFDEEIGGEDGVGALISEGYRAEVCVLPDAGDNWRIETTQKGVWLALITANGVAAHGSRPWEGDNAVERLIDALQQIRGLFRGQNVETESLSVNLISGGSAINQVPDHAQASLDIRFLNDEDFDRLRTEINAITTKHRLSLETINCIKPVKTDLKNPYVASFLSLAAEIHGRPLETICSLGTSDAHFFADNNIPVILLRPDGGAPHSDQEWIDLQSLEKYYQLIRNFIQKEAKSKR